MTLPLVKVMRQLAPGVVVQVDVWVWFALRLGRWLLTKVPLGTISDTFVDPPAGLFVSLGAELCPVLGLLFVVFFAGSPFVSELAVPRLTVFFLAGA